MWRKALVIVMIFGTTSVWSQYYECHDDPVFEPDEGPIKELQYTWLGALQYVHVKKGNPHYFRVPRVILVSRQFVLSTAKDAAEVPEGYALGNVVFGEYERDEDECQASVVDLVNRVAVCHPVTLVMPLADVLVHPEYKHFGAKNSVALLKLILPVRSKYVLPVCLPFRDFLVDKSGKKIALKLYHVDFVSDVPRDFIEEDKEVTHIAVLPRELCGINETYTDRDSDTHSRVDRVACTTGCDFRSGAPSVVHENTGQWSVVSISQGGPPCPDPLRRRRENRRPRHTLIYPYLPWITTAISGKAVGGFFKDDPFGFPVPRVVAPLVITHFWVGHWWMGGIRCYDRGAATDTLYRFYHEIFEITPPKKTLLTYFLELSSAKDTNIVCVKIGMPYQLGIPMLWGLDTPEIKVRIPLMIFQNTYRFQVEAWGANATEDSSSSEESDG